MYCFILKIIFAAHVKSSQNDWRQKIKVIPEGVEFKENLMFTKSKKDEKVVLYHVLCVALCSFCGKKLRRCSEMTVRDVLYGNVVVRT